MKCNSTQKKFFYFFVLVAFFFTFLKFNYTPLPTEQDTFKHFSNQTGCDLRNLIINAISSAQNSIHLSIYNLSDKKIINILNKKAEDGIDVKIFADDKATKKDKSSLLSPKIYFVRWKGSSLMHRKILVVDDKKVFIGSANFSWQSLLMHANLITGFISEPAAKFFIEHFPKKLDSLFHSHSNEVDQVVLQDESEICNDKACKPCQKDLLEPDCKAKVQISLEFCEKDKQKEGPIPKTYSIQRSKGLTYEIYMLPDEGEALKKLTNILQGAKKTIRVAMYVFTHTNLANELAEAKKRGVDVQVALDGKQAKKVSKKICDFLQKNRIKTFLYTGKGILHHKFAVIDSKTLINGSTNWTHAAFNRNYESFIIIPTICKKQSKFMDRVWSQIVSDSKTVP